MILCIDVGNTDIVVGVFEDDSYKRSFRFEYVKGLCANDYLLFLKDKFILNSVNVNNIDGCLICCVAINTLDGLNLALQTLLGVTPYIFTNDDKCDLEVLIGDPNEIGTDILASCLEIKHNNNLPAIVIDMGSATTITAMDKNANILGVSILTGVLTSLNALKDKTSLPIDTTLAPPPSAIGINTPHSIASGAILGSAYCLDGMIEAFEKEMGTSANIYATGGTAKFIIPFCKREIYYDDNLLLKGLYAYYKNCIM